MYKRYMSYSSFHVFISLFGLLYIISGSAAHVDHNRYLKKIPMDGLLGAESVLTAWEPGVSAVFLSISIDLSL
jgi:hypothetical protein